MTDIAPARLRPTLDALRTQGVGVVVVDSPLRSETAALEVARAADLVVVPIRRVPTRFVQKYTVRARLDPARGSAGFRPSLSSSREDDQGANTAEPPRRRRGRRPRPPRRPPPPPPRRPRDSRLSCAPPCRVTTSATGRQSHRRANQKPERAKVHRRGRARPPAATGQPPVVCPRPAGRRWPRTAGRAPAQVHVDHAPASATRPPERPPGRSREEINQPTSTHVDIATGRPAGDSRCRTP